MIEIRNLSKLFGALRAVNCITFDIEEGSIFGLVGSNGAGKSTLLRMISGVYQADEGEILIDGAQPYENIDVKNK
ncbi:MAG: ATP-binding cassette domain-containing protein, partial [Clostridiales bacterium]|nr:ATP-binding cassette domain-containing protein [Clostridiales bacterium]